ncbi:MAG: hypothetical protein H6592_07970 [Flavobacteriales bacterium]|nr:hypothetical protein [Flavobacteriales bacterium]
MTLPRLKGALLNTWLLALTLLLSGTVNGQRYFFENIGVQEDCLHPRSMRPFRMVTGSYGSVPKPVSPATMATPW